MLFQSIVNKTVSEVFQDAMTQANELRKADARKRLDFYHDDQLPHLWAKLNDEFQNPERFQQVFVNLVKKVVNNLAQVYQQPPVRKVEGTKRDAEIFSRITEQSNLDAKMKLASRYAKLLKTVALRPVWRNGKMDLDVLTPDLLDADWQDTPENLESIMVTHYGSDNRLEDVTYSIWTPEYWKRLDYRGFELDGDSNPYGILPFVPVWDSLPTTSFWVPGGADLVAVQEAVNARLVDLLYVLKFQGFGVMWTKGMKAEPDIVVGPGHNVDLPENGELGFASTQAPVDAILESIHRLMSWLAVSNGLSASSLNTEVSDESGISKIINNLEMQEKRQDDVALFRNYEKDLFEIFRVVWNAHNPGEPISDCATMAIDFYDPRPTMYVKEQAETWQKLIDMGVINAIDVVLERNPDLKTRDQALEHLQLLEDEQRQVNTITLAGLDDAFTARTVIKSKAFQTAIDKKIALYLLGGLDAGEQDKVMKDIEKTNKKASLLADQLQQMDAGFQEAEDRKTEMEQQRQ